MYGIKVDSYLLNECKIEGNRVNNWPEDCPVCFASTVGCDYCHGTGIHFGQTEDKNIFRVLMKDFTESGEEFNFAIFVDPKDRRIPKETASWLNLSKEDELRVMSIVIAEEEFPGAYAVKSVKYF